MSEHDSSRQAHQADVHAFLRAHVGDGDWSLTLPPGSGHETYLAQSAARRCFIKLGAQPARYQALAALGLSPEILAHGQLPDATPILVQAFIAGRKPRRADYRELLESFATSIRRVHTSPALQQILPPAASHRFSAAGLASLAEVQQRWTHSKPQVPAIAAFVDDSLAALADQLAAVPGAGLVASHNDICNANWLVTEHNHLYLLDVDSMSLDDPAHDLGATLWWYVPPTLRPRFLAAAGYPDDEPFRARMRLRMALHCLSITLPRPGSFDRFDSAAYAATLTDFRAVMAGQENPQGYAD